MLRDSACHFSSEPVEQDARERALEFLDRCAIAVSPLAYAVAYDYAVRRTPGLHKDIDRILMRGRRPDDKLLQTLFERYFLAEQGSGLDSRLADIHDVLFHVLEGMAKAGTGMCEFGEVLEAQLAELYNRPGVDAVREIAERLAGATEQAMRSNQGLRLSLEKTQREADQLRKELVRVKEQANTDGLTGLLTRKAFDALLREHMDKASAGQGSLALLLMDIDHFKNFNDTYGHPLGDEIIRSVSATIRKQVRGTDHAGRYGGEEFIVLLPNTDLIGALTVAGTVHRAIGRLSLVRKVTGERLPSVTVSVGVAALGAGDDADSLLERTDKALYTAKRSGRNRVVSERGIASGPSARSA